MDSNKKLLVLLSCSTKGIEPQELEASHAEKLLKMPNNGGWYLPKDSKFDFDSKKGLSLKAAEKA